MVFAMEVRQKSCIVVNTFFFEIVKISNVLFSNEIQNIYIVSLIILGY